MSRFREKRDLRRRMSDLFFFPFLLSLLGWNSISISTFGGEFVGEAGDGSGRTRFARGGLRLGVEALEMWYLGVEGYFCGVVWVLYSVDVARGSRQNSAGGT